jgi:hypothetical protein
MLKVNDRVKQSSLTEGDVNYVVLNDTFGSFQSFADGIGDGNTTYYTIENNDQFEVGIGTYDLATDTLYRDKILQSSNNDQRITLLGVSVVFCTYPADKAVFLNPSGYIDSLPTYYSGIQFPDSGIQYHAINGSGSPHLLTFWSDNRELSADENLHWSVETNTLTVGGITNFLSDVTVYGNLTVQGTQYVSETQIINSQITDTTFNNTTFYRDDAGCFFHAYVDNEWDNTIALYSTNELCTEWRLGVKDYSTAFESPPTRGYVFGDCRTVGGVVNPDTYYVIADPVGFYINHRSYNVLHSYQGSVLTPSNNFFSSVGSITPVGIHGAVSQSADLTVWRNSNDITLAKVYYDGKASFNCYEFPDQTVQCTAFTKECITIDQESFLSRSYDFMFLEVNSTFDVFLDSAANVDCGTTMVIKRKKIPNQPKNNYKVNIRPKLGSNETIDGYNILTINYTNEAMTLVSDGENWQII